MKNIIFFLFAMIISSITCGQNMFFAGIDTPDTTHTGIAGWSQTSAGGSSGSTAGSTLTPSDSPLIIVDPTSLDFGYTASSGTSSELTYSLTAQFLSPASGNITIVPTANFEISLTTGSGFSASPITIAYTGGSLSATTIYVQFKPTAPNINYSGNIVHDGGGASTQFVSVTGTSVATYCIPVYSSAGSNEDFMTQVTLGVLSQVTASNDMPYYIDYTATQNAIPDLRQGTTNSLTLTFGNDPNQYNGVWLDFNNDGIFENSEFFTSGTNAGPYGTATVGIIVPVDATLGKIRMRIRGGDDEQPDATQACGLSHSIYGQGQDYFVNIKAGFCIPTYAYGGGNDYIVQVTLDGLSQATAGNNPPFYIDYTTTQNTIPYLQQGSTNLLLLTFGSDPNQYNGVWLDFNNDGIFDPSEFFSSNTDGGSDATVSVSIIVPVSASLGNIRMRIRGGDDSQPSATQACGPSNSAYGQAQDYLVNITSVFCVPTYASVGQNQDFITQVTLDGLSQATVSNDAPYYIDYTATQNSIPSVSQNSVISLSLFFGNGDAQYNGVWLDFNNNGIFEDSEFFTSNTNAGANGTAVVSIIVPVNAMLGHIHMRIRGGDDFQPDAGQACGPTNSIYGQAQDYLVNITAGFCIPTYYNGGGSDYITQVTLGGLSQETAGNDPPYYIDYTASQNTIPNLQKVTTNSLSITFGGDSGQYNGVWLDFNNDGTFDPSEFFSSYTNAGSNGMAVVNLIVPIDAAIGIIRMRIRGGDDSQPLATQACGASNSSFGQGQDYLVEITTTVVWTGGTDTNWGNPGNWNPMGVPGAFSDAVIPAVANLPVVNEAPSAPAICCNLTIQSGASVTVSPGKRLTVKGTLSVLAP